ncbi:MAG: hypothetical protein IRZ28_11220 [Steroidobacteraceae bacterium]|nr:hypothetical protein [Steroidobacteraceae bacterium]
MALDVTITPALGHAVLFTQGGDGAPGAGYDAIDLRRLFTCAGAFQPGVFGANDWKVTERASGGANLSVDVAANAGMAVVPNSALITPRDFYLVAPHSSVVNLSSVPANTSGNPRVDYVVLQVRNQDHDGSGEYDARVRYLVGTPNAAASHSNPAGAPTIPASSLLLAQLLVPTGTTSAITNGMIRDRRPWARGALDVAESSATFNPGVGFQQIDSANLSRRVECSGAPIEVTISGRLLAQPSARLDVRLRIDGLDVTVAGDQRFTSLGVAPGGAQVDGRFDATFLIASPTPGSRLFQFVATGSSTSISQIQTVIRELDRAPASNGS